MTLKEQMMAILEHAETIADMTEGIVVDFHCESCGETFWHVNDFNGGGAKCPYCGGGDTHEC